MVSFKLTVDGTEYQDDRAIKLVCRRPENNISSLAVQVDDTKSRTYSDLFDVHDTIVLELADNPDATFTTVFSGLIHNLKPVASVDGGTQLEAQAWGKGIALAKTTCNTSYGVESANPTIDTPEEILDDIIANHINKRWGGANTNWGIDGTDIDAPHADLSVTNLTFNYLDNFSCINRLCDLINAHAVVGADISVHWFVDTDGHFRMKEIDQASVDTTWGHFYVPPYGIGTAAMYEDYGHFVSRGLHKNAEDYANHVIVAAGFRKPADEVWSEDGGPAWGEVDADYSYSAAAYVVGSHSLLIEPNNSPSVGYAYYPSTHDAAWDFTKCGSEKTIPTLNFYVQVSDTAMISSGQAGVILFKDATQVGDANNNYYWTYLRDFVNDVADEWFHVSIPIGPYYANSPILQRYDAGGATERTWKWNETVDTALDWSEINGVIFVAGTNNAYNLYIDDLHFAGSIIRSCYDTTDIAATGYERQVFLRLDSAVDDTLVANDDDAGAAAMVAVSELYRRKEMPYTGTLELRLSPTMLPGQTVYLYAGPTEGGSYRWNNVDVRFKEITHIIQAGSAMTSVQVTSDVTNTFAAGVPSMYDILLDSAGALGMGQAKDLKTGKIDNLIPVLAWDPT